MPAAASDATAILHTGLRLHAVCREKPRERRPVALRTLDRPMENATWTIGPCDADAACGGSPRSSALEPDDRGGARPARATTTRRRRGRSSKARCRGTIPFALGDMREAVEAIRARPSSAARASASTATTTPTASAPRRSPSSCCASSAPSPTWHLPSRFEEGYGLAAQTLARLAGEGVELVLTVDCGITAVAEVAEARRLGPRGRRHRPPPARPTTFPACPVVAPLKGDYPFTGLCGTAVVWKLAEALLGAGPSVPRAPPRRRRARDRRRRRAARRREPRARAARVCAGSRRRRSPALRALMRVAGVDPAACDEGAIGFRLAPRINAVRPARPARGGARAPADRRRRRGDAARRGARGAEPRAAGGRGADPARRGRRDRVVAGGARGATAATSSPARTGTRA